MATELTFAERAERVYVDLLDLRADIRSFCEELDNHIADSGIDSEDVDACSSDANRAAGIATMEWNYLLQALRRAGI